MRKRKIDYGLLLRQSLERDRQRAEAQNDLERQEEKRNQLKLWKKFIQTQKERRKEYWFTSDEHYGHQNIIKYCKRPFLSVKEMDRQLIINFNNVVCHNDITIHAGDFTLLKNSKNVYEKYISKLNGNHIFLKGSHDYWLDQNKSQQIWEKTIHGFYFVVCHYAMRTWARSHYNSFQLFGHSHGHLLATGKQYDIGVDNNKFYPISARSIIELMESKSDNENFIGIKK